MCRVLNMSEFWIFVIFRKYDRILNMCQDAIMEGFWVFQDSEGSEYFRIPQGSEYAWIMPYGRVRNMLGQRFTGF